MAREPDPAVVEFMRRIQAALGAATPVEFFEKAVELGAVKATERRKFDKWRGGHNGPNHQETLALLRAAASEMAGDLAGRLGSLEARADESDQERTQVEAHLARLVERVAALEAARGAAQNKAR